MSMTFTHITFPAAPARARGAAPCQKWLGMNTESRDQPALVERLMR